MSSIAFSSAARRSLRFDALVSGAFGALLAIVPRLLQDVLGLPVPLLVGAGAFCMAWALFLTWLSRTPTLSRRAMVAVVVLNVFWVVDSIALLFTGWVAPTTLGLAFVVAQAATVAGIALWQWRGASGHVAMA